MLQPLLGHPTFKHAVVPLLSSYARNCFRDQLCFGPSIGSLLTSAFLVV